MKRTTGLPYTVFMTVPTSASVERLASPRCTVRFMLMRLGGWQLGNVSWLDSAPADPAEAERIVDEAWSVLEGRLARHGRN